ncbi:MAG: right-handed parallel beta-helix repeat-containing protein [Planctomycetes bacterium]|nr:right-handed parallel beta-helix repeat-containing protein [Planctomycetota bacterium]
MTSHRSTFSHVTRGLGAAVALLGALSAQTVIKVPNRPPIQPVPHNQADWSCGDVYYVATNGDDNTGNGSLATPWRSISFAVPQALSLSATGSPITINVRAGLYDGVTESFPITLPARGIKLQAFEPGVTVRGVGNTAVLQVNRKGSQSGPCGFTPDTVIRGLMLREGLNGIEIDTSMVGGTPATTPDRVRIQRCTIVDNTSKGILLSTASGRRSQHVIEENEIAYNADSQGFGHGIRAFHDGDSSCLIRANYIHDNEVGIEIWGASGQADHVRPRIACNIVRDSEWGIALAWCSSYLVNNTQGYGRPFSSGTMVYGVLLGTEGDHVVANNIMWNPASYAGTSAVADYDTSSLSGTTTEATNWVLQVVGLGNPPGFVSPPVAQGSGDLHLSSTSPLLEAGTNSYVLPEIDVTAGTITARADVGMDFDGDSRVLDFDRNAAALVEIGADELTGGTTVRLVTTGADAFGNVHTGGVSTTIPLLMSGLPGDMVLVYLWLPSAEDPIIPNTFVDPFGNWRITTNNLVGVGTVPPNGVFTMNLTLDPAVLGLERQVYVQALTSDGSHSLGTITNRLLLEIDE